jgi:NitT/TauT family transport system permease protein
MMRLLLNIALGLGLFLALWWALAAYVQHEVIPYPGQVLEVLGKDKVREDLHEHSLVSGRRIAYGLALATLGGFPLGLALGQSRFLDGLLWPLISLLYPIPKVVFLPVVLILFGTGDESKVALIVMVIAFQILVVVRDEARALPPDLIESVRSLGAGRRALYRYVYLPASLGAVLTAWRISVGTAVAVLFIAETTATRAGLGYYIIDNSQRLRYEQMYAGILAISLLGGSLYFLTDLLERLFVKQAQH